MKNIKTKITGIVFIVVLSALGSCSLDYSNPNSATLDQFDTVESFYALALGIRQQYSTDAFGNMVFVPSLTTGETSSILTNVENQQIEPGGNSITVTNNRIKDLFFYLVSVKGMSEILIEKVPNIVASDDAKKGLLAWGYFFRALAIGGLVNNFEQIPLINSIDNNATYVSSNKALEEAIKILNDAATTIQSLEGSTDESFVKIKETIWKGISLKDCIYAYLSRYNLMLGQYQKTLDNAKKVDLTKKSVFMYDNQSQNPMYVGLVKKGENLFYGCQVGFGLPRNLLPEPGDGRVAFYLTNDNEISLFSKPVVLGTSSPFFSTASSEVPVYLPGEIILNIAEAYARLEGDNSANAISHINKIRTKNDDVFGVNANLPVYSGGTAREDLLNEIYKNKRIELYLTGMSLENSRRFERPQDERSRNYYPYPYVERASNPNTPLDPSF